MKLSPSFSQNCCESSVATLRRCLRARDGGPVSLPGCQHRYRHSATHGPFVHPRCPWCSSKPASIASVNRFRGQLKPNARWVGCHVQPRQVGCRELLGWQTGVADGSSYRHCRTATDTQIYGDVSRTLHFLKSPISYAVLSCGAWRVGEHWVMVRPPEITLVADQHDDDVRVGVVPQLFQPPLHVVERHCA